MKILLILCFACLFLSGHLMGLSEEELGKIQTVLKEGSLEEKEEVAGDVYTHPEKYDPDLWLDAGLYFISDREFEKGAVLCIGAVIRTEIDVRLQGERNFQAVPGSMQSIINTYVYDLNLTKEEMESWIKAGRKAISDFPIWNEKIPLDHTLATPLTKEEKTKVIARIYKEIKFILANRRYIPTEDDAFLAREQDCWFFEPKTQLFKLHNVLSFIVPDGLIVDIDNFGKYSGDFYKKEGNREHLSISYRVPIESIESWYKNAVKIEKEGFQESKHKVTEAMVTSTIKAYHETYFDEPLLVHKYTFIIPQKGECVMQVQCCKESEKEWLEIIKVLFHSMAILPAQKDSK